MQDIYFGFAPEDFKIKDIGDELARYSREIIRFIVIHEFCHLKYKNHTKSFNELMEKYIFNYDEILKQVKGLKF